MRSPARSPGRQQQKTKYGRRQLCKTKACFSGALTARCTPCKRKLARQNGKRRWAAEFTRRPTLLKIGSMQDAETDTSTRWTHEPAVFFGQPKPVMASTATRLFGPAR